VEDRRIQRLPQRHRQGRRHVRERADDLAADVLQQIGDAHAQQQLVFDEQHPGMSIERPRHRGLTFSQTSPSPPSLAWDHLGSAPCAYSAQRSYGGVAMLTRDIAAAKSGRAMPTYLPQHTHNPVDCPRSERLYRFEPRWLLPAPIGRLNWPVERSKE